MTEKLPEKTSFGTNPSEIKTIFEQFKKFYFSQSSETGDSLPDISVFKKFETLFKNSLQKAENQKLSLQNSFSDFLIHGEFIPSAVFVHDTEGNILYANSKAEDLTAYSKSELSAMNVADLDPETASRAYEDNIWKSLKIGDIKTINARNIRKDGTQYHSEIRLSCINNNGATAFVAIVQDISKMLKIQQALKESEAKYRLLSENTADGVVLWEGGKIKYISPAYERMFGYKQSEIQDVFSFLHPKDSFRIKFKIAKALKKKLKEFSYRYRARCKSGKYIWAEDSITIQFDEQGNHLRSIIHSRDISDRKEAEQIIHKQNEQLKALLAEKDKFLQVIAHDLRNPFNNLIGFSELLADNYYEFPKETIKDILKAMHHVSLSSINLLQDLLLWSKSQTGKLFVNKEKICFAECCREVLETLKYPARKKDLSIEFPEHNGLYFHADKNMLKTILRNYLSNAVKFSHPGGKIRIFGKPKGKYAHITVADEGIGIHADNLQKLWAQSDKPYSTLGTQSEKGAGIGLGLCKEFTEKQGGRVWVESQHGQGSHFSFSVPLYTG